MERQQSGRKSIPPPATLLFVCVGARVRKLHFDGSSKAELTLQIEKRATLLA